MFKPFFVHEHRQPGKMSNRGPRGFTVFVGPDQHIKGNVLVSTAWCSPKDQFIKKVGREHAANSYPISMKAHMLPKHVSGCYATLYPESWTAQQESTFFYLFKRML